MAPLKAVVRNGRLVVDEPTELPEGTEIELVAVDAISTLTSGRVSFERSTTASRTSNEAITWTDSNSSRR